MAGRSEWMRSKAKHDQRPIPTKKAAPLDDSVWFSKGMEACRDLASVTDNEFSHLAFASLMGIARADEAERRLRVLTRAGFLHMKAEKAPSGSFIRYVWSLRDPSLPASRDITE